MKRRRSLLWLLQAGTVAARRQLLAVLIVTSLFGLLSKSGLAGPLLTPGSSGRLEVSPALTWSYLLLAVNSAILPKHLIASTAAQIRLITRRLSPMNPNKEAIELSSMLWLAAISDGVLTVTPPPALLLTVSGYFRCSTAGAIGWVALMSIGVAFFGANGLAARKIV
ncbi:hypothetical protein [Sphingopyxis sp. GW247-27LB]|uniref:hypothetical protein n=1 Tax=Sphingopyxis sp. GW247-27LB TaxID=2012632 RepID=UPI001140D779|nr:hypothetical protein [Sphingopyxis sp. GW247-27LB]